MAVSSLAFTSGQRSTSPRTPLLVSRVEAAPTRSVIASTLSPVWHRTEMPVGDQNGLGPIGDMPQLELRQQSFHA